MTERSKDEVELVNSRYQPTKAELEESLEIPKGTTPDDVAKAVMQDARIRWIDQPE